MEFLSKIADAFDPKNSENIVTNVMQKVSDTVGIIAGGQPKMNQPKIQFPQNQMPKYRLQQQQSQPQQVQAQQVQPQSQPQVQPQVHPGFAPQPCYPNRPNFVGLPSIQIVND